MRTYSLCIVLCVFACVCVFSLAVFSQNAVFRNSGCSLLPQVAPLGKLFQPDFPVGLSGDCLVGSWGKGLQDCGIVSSFCGPRIHTLTLSYTLLGQFVINIVELSLPAYMAFGDICSR